MIINQRLKIKVQSYLATAAGAAVFAIGFFVGPAIASAATLSLSPSSGSVASGSTLEVKVNLDTGGTKTSGTDVYINFDPGAFQVVDANPATDGTQILAGSLYSQTTFNSVDNSAGKISFSGSKTASSPGYSGTGTLATITFQAVKESSASSVAFDFTAGSTTDSNVISQSDGSDLLTSVTSGSYTITASSANTGSTSGTDTGAAGTGGTSGTGGSGSVAGTGIDLSGYMVLTVISLFGAMFFLTRRTKRS